MVFSNSRRKKKILKAVLITLGSIIGAFIVVVGVCMYIQRPAVHSFSEYAAQFPDAVISVEKNGSVDILPSNRIESNGIGIIFYTGAQITPDAYIPLMARLSEKGYYCCLPHIAHNLASLSPSAAEDVIKSRSGEKIWILAGHSMGGLTASGFTKDHMDLVDGLILIGAYTNRDFSDSGLPMLSIYGDLDSVLNKKLYNKRLSWNSDNFDEHIIVGGNHAGFGDYGKQPRDTDAAISAEEQQEQTAEIIDTWINENFMSEASHD